MNDLNEARQFQLMQTSQLHFSPQLRLIVGFDSGTRQSVILKIWDYIKEHNLRLEQNPSYFMPDERLQPIFGNKPVSSFACSRYLSRHMF